MHGIEPDLIHFRLVQLKNQLCMLKHCRSVGRVLLLLNWRFEFLS